MSYRGGRGGFRNDRGGFRGNRGGGSGGRGGFQQGPPDTVQEMGTFLHATEGEMVCTSTSKRIPMFSANIYLENKTPIGKIDEILGPINQVYFTIKPNQGIQATSFRVGDKVYIGGDRTLPLEKFLPKPKPLPGAPKVKKPQRGNGQMRGQRGGFQRGQRGQRGGGRGSRGGFNSRGGSGGFNRGRARGRY